MIFKLVEDFQTNRLLGAVIVLNPSALESAGHNLFNSPHGLKAIGAKVGTGIIEAKSYLYIALNGFILSIDTPIAVVINSFKRMSLGRINR